MATAKEKGDYTDRTANLRNSVHINYLFKDIIIEPSDERVSMPSGMDDAVIEIRKNNISAFIGVGMSYGLHVENKGYDVLTGTMEMLKDAFTKDLRNILKVKKHEIQM